MSFFEKLFAKKKNGVKINSVIETTGKPEVQPENQQATPLKLTDKHPGLKRKNKGEFGKGRLKRGLKPGAKSPSGIVINNNINLDSAKPKTQRRRVKRTIKPSAKPTARPMVKRTANAKPVAVKQTIKPGAKPTARPMVKRTANAKPVAVKQTIKPGTKPTARPMVKQPIKPVAKPAARPQRVMPYRVIKH